MKLSLGALSIVSMALAAPLAAGCSPADAGDESGENGSEIGENASGPPKLCAAVRGNGNHIITHFASLARITEHYGVIDGIAGGSSGSLTTFVYESVLKNPSVSQCGARRCGKEKRAARVSLALKSLEGYGVAVAGSDEGVAIGNLVGVAGTLKKEVDKRGIAAMTDAALAAQKLKEVLEIPEVRDLVNPEVFAMLRDTQHLAYNVKEIQTSIATLGAFSVDDNRLFFRPSVLNWDALSVQFGHVADFYAGYGAADQGAQAAWLDACAVPSEGKPWQEAAALPFGDEGGTCGDAFARLASDYRAKTRASGEAPRRLSERVGAPGPLHKIVTTSVLEGAAVSAYKAGRAAYLSGAYATGSLPFDVSFDDIKFGYWGSDEDLATIAESNRFVDLKTKKATFLGNGSWKEVLTASPAEPGLSRFVELPDGRISAGGWSDLAPTLVLKNMGCERVVYVTREGDESGFAAKIAKNLGMSEADWNGLYDLGNANSSFNVSLENADAVWCTNWNSFSDVQQREMAADSWSASLETRPSFTGVPKLSRYENTTPRTGKAGCTPGISGGATYPR